MENYSIHRVVLAVLISVTLHIAPTIASATVIYSEAVSGDLPGDQNDPSLVGSFVVGVNTVLGHDSIGSDTSSQGDTFGLSLLAGQHIDSIAISITSNSNTADGFVARIFESPYEQIGNIVQNPGASGTFNFTPFTVQTPGQYNFSTQFFTNEHPSQGFDWQWDIQVSDVPEPSKAAFLLAGIVAFAWASRKQQSR